MNFHNDSKTVAGLWSLVVRDHPPRQTLPNETEGLLLAASNSVQQTYNFIEGGRIGANGSDHIHG
jgi:hypothetical protein